MKLNELRKMVKTALREFDASGGALSTGSGYYEDPAEPKPFEDRSEEERTDLSFANDDEPDRPNDTGRSIASVRQEIHKLLDETMEILKAPTETNTASYQENMVKLDVLNQELENLSAAREKEK